MPDNRLLLKADTRQSSDAFVDETLDFWQPRLSNELTREDARRLGENLLGFFRILIDWDASHPNDEEESRVVANMSEGEAS